MSMTHTTRSQIVCYFTLITLSGFSADAAEVRLKAEHHCRGALVLLGDVAEVQDTDANIQAALSGIELFPAPAHVESVRQREIQELLALRGVNLAECRFAGASSVKIHPVGTPPAISETVRRLGRVELESTRVGRQTFDVSSGSENGEVRASASAQVTTPTMVVTAIRPIRRGDIVQAADLQLLPAADHANVRDLIHRVEEVVGKEANRPIAAGQPVDVRAIRLPLLVRRGELVTVVARAAGVQVRTTARAQDEGSRGDVITVQSIEHQQRYAARVADLRVVEVYARGPTITDTTPDSFHAVRQVAPERIHFGDHQSPAKLEP